MVATKSEANSLCGDSREVSLNIKPSLGPVVPFSAVSVFFSAVSGGNNFFTRRFISWMSFPALVFVLIMNLRSANPEAGFQASNNIFLNVDIGFWLALVFSFLLVFVKGNKKTQYINELSFFE